ncbi:succinylglutamate desuccinylase/aspartoacylase family protein [Massilia soli]|uniref:Succinylglutamate desuccinylase/aspartoacylase family protein n=1 Tax=Massilia soli TaxID=2792854 RepID=A0ABS7SNC8_9BURK|nr:succinylglutamate desuccinylase/aspartoacylase family protein [Massilia soli]MBZ2207684.1 succinylglutamate desuccinylase/aspartoacylase family protein [Massilia soli]
MQVQKHDICPSGSSTSHHLTSLHFGTPGAGKKAYLQAALHADEVPGMLVAQFLRNELLALEAAGSIRGEVVLVPAANPLGLAQAIHGAPFGRFDLTTGTNFNRAYKHVADELKATLAGRLGADAAANVALIRRHARSAVGDWAPRTDAETLKKVLLGMAIDADIVLDLHCDNEAVMHIYAGTPLAQAVAPLAALLGARALLVALEAGEEPFDEACSRLWWDLAAHFGEAAIPPACVAATVELRGEMEVDYDLARSDATAILRFLAHQGVIDAEVGQLPAATCAATPLEAVEPVAAPHAGVLVFRKRLGEQVAAGEALADLIDPVSGATTELRAGVAGVFFARTAHRYVLRGMAVGKVAGTVAFRAGKLLSQ